MLFTLTADGVTYQPHPQSSINPNHLKYFHFVGKSDKIILFLNFFFLSALNMIRTTNREGDLRRPIDGRPFQQIPLLTHFRFFK